MPIFHMDQMKDQNSPGSRISTNFHSIGRSGEKNNRFQKKPDKISLRNSLRNAFN